MKTQITSDVIVSPLAYDGQEWEDAANSAGTEKPKASNNIVRSVASVLGGFQSVIRLSRYTQRLVSNSIDLPLTLSVQHIAFNNTCRLLLSSIARGRQDVDNMLSNQRHSVWKDKGACATLKVIMARFYPLCLEPLEHFLEILRAMRMGLQSLLKRIATRRYLFCGIGSGSANLGTVDDFLEFVQGMRTYNDLFSTLVRQATMGGFKPDTGVTSARCPDILQSSKATKKSYEHISCIQESSRSLYDTLSRSVHRYENEAHSMDIYVRYEYSKVGRLISRSGPCFKIVFTTPNFDRKYHMLARFEEYEKDWVSDMTIVENEPPESTAYAETSRSPSLDSDTALREVGGRRKGTLENAKSLSNFVRDLGLQKDLRPYLRMSYVTSDHTTQAEHPDLEYVKLANEFIIPSFYMLKEGHHKHRSTPLDGVLARANSERHTFPIEDRFRTASSIASEVLYLRNSPWLPQVWSSKDIQLFHENEADKKITLGEPFFRSQPKNNDVLPGSGKKGSDVSRSSLLSLGLVLIEIAFSSPWHQLQLPGNILRDLSEQERNYLELLRLSESVSRQSGQTYADAVHACFYELHKPLEGDVDKYIFENVVEKLNRCLSAISENSDVPDDDTDSRSEDLKPVLRDHPFDGDWHP